MRKHLWLPMLVLLAAPAVANAQVKLAWRLKKGERFFVEETTNVRQTIKIMETETRQDLEETKVSRFTVLTTEKDGGAVLEQTIQSVKIKHSGEGPDVDTKVLKQLEGASFQVTLDARGQVIKFAGYDELLKKIAKTDPLNAKPVRALMSEDSFKAGLTSLFGFVPEKKVARGDSWEHKHVLPLGPLGVLNLDDRYKFEDVEEAGKIVKVALTSHGTYAAPPQTPDAALKIARGEIRLLKSVSTLRFDAARGRLLGSETKSRLEGTLQVVVRDAPVTMYLEQEAQRKLRVFEKSPLEK
jgi:hypothetical protein